MGVSYASVNGGYFLPAARAAQGSLTISIQLGSPLMAYCRSAVSVPEAWSIAYVVRLFDLRPAANR